VKCATAIAAQSGENDTQYQVPVGKVQGFVYLVPNQELQGYTVINGDAVCATAISAQLGENDTQNQRPVGSVQGFVYLLPNQELRGYIVINGEF